MLPQTSSPGLRGRPATIEASKATGVEGALNSLQAALEEVDVQLDHLRAKLSPVLCVVPDKSPGENPCEPAQCELERRIIDLRQHVEHSISTIRDLHHCVAL